MKRLAALLLLLSTPAMAQDAPVESVTAYGSSMTGIWRVSQPDYVAIEGFFSPAKFGPSRDSFCRIAPQKDDLIMVCTRNERAATVTVDGSHVHFAWGTMMARIVIDGELESPSHFRGHFQIKVSGIAIEDPGFSEAARVTPDPAAPDKAGEATLLRRILDDGLAGVPQDADVMKKNRSAFDLPKLGAVQTVVYLGQETKWSTPRRPGGKPDPNSIPDQPDFFGVYLVTFADGERLCRLHQREDGVLDAFRCV